MTSALAFILGAAAVAAGLSVCVAVISAGALALASKRASAARRADLAFTCAVLPGVTALVGTVAAALPSVLAALGADDHCLHHLHHAHLCPVHSGALHSRILVVGALALAFSATVLVVWIARAARGARFVRGARAVGERSTVDGITVVALGGAPRLLHAVGALHPIVVVSAALLEALSPSARVAVLAHEAAHVRRRDGLALWLLSMLSFVSPPVFSAWARRAFLSAADEAADEEAAVVVGPLAVAAALVEVAQRRSRSPLDGIALAADGGSIEARVNRLLHLRPRRHTPQLHVVAVAGVCAALAMLSWSESVHHAVETALFFFT